MKKIVYICDCCKRPIDDPIQIIPASEEGAVINKYLHMQDRHFCQSCLDDAVTLLVDSISLDGLYDSLKGMEDAKVRAEAEATEYKGMVEALNADIEQLKAEAPADPEEMQRIKNKADEMEAKIAKQATYINTLRSEIDHLRMKPEGEEQNPVTILSPEDIPEEPKVTARVKRKALPGDQFAPKDIDKAQVLRMVRESDMTYKEIAERVGCHPSRISQIVTQEKKRAEKEAKKKKLPEADE